MPETTHAAASAASGRLQAVLLSLLLAVAALSWVPRLTTPIDLRNDASVYYMLGTSLAEGRGYRLLNEPGNVAATQYPPVLPALVALHQRALGTSDPAVVGRWLRSTFFLVYISFSLSLYLLLRLHLPSACAFFAALITLLSTYTYLMSNLLVPEVLFGLTTTLFFWCHHHNHRRGYFVGSYLLAVASYGLRTIGVALFAAWITEAVLEKDVKQVFLRLALSVLPVLGWQGYIHHVESSVDYRSPAYAYQRADYLFYNVSYARNIFLKDPFRPESGRATLADTARRFSANLVRMPGHMGEVVTVEKKLWVWPLFPSHPRKSALALDLVLMALGCLIIGGLALQLARRQWIMPLYVAFTIAVVCLTPWEVQLVRYLTPLCPFLALALWTSLRSLDSQASKLSPAAGTVVRSVWLVPLVGLILVEQSITYYQAHTSWIDTITYEVRGGGTTRHQAFGYFQSERDLNAGLDWLLEHAEPGAVVAASVPTWVYLRTGVKAVMPPFERDPDKAQQLLDSVPVSYLFLERDNFNINGETTSHYVSPVVEQHPDLWAEVYSNPDGRMKIYRRARAAR
jgi:hypothetical protein